MADANLVGSRLEAARSAAPLVAEQIEYMADMILELQEMAGRAGLSTLSGILLLAYGEARLQIGRHSMADGESDLAGGC